MKSKWSKILIAIVSCLVLALGAVVGIFADEWFKENHECEFETTWSYDDTYHWHNCTDIICDEISDKAEHIDENSDNICDVCLYGSKVLVNGVNYDTLQDAVNSYTNEPITLTLFEDTTDSGLVVNGQEIIIDLNGKTYTPNQGVGSNGTATNGFQFLKGSKVTIKNGTIKATSGIGILIQNYADLTLENVILDGRDLDSSKQWNYTLSNNCGNVVIKGATYIYSKEYREDGLNFAFDACRYSTYTDGVTVSFEDFTGSIIGRVEISGNAPEKVGSAKIVKPDGTELTENGIYTI